MAKNSVRIRLKAYEHRILDASAEKIVQAAQAHGAKKLLDQYLFQLKSRWLQSCVRYTKTKILASSSRSERTNV